MTANQRRPGFRLPWSSEMDAEGGEVASGGEDESMTTPTSDGHVADAAVDEPNPETQPTPETPAEPAAEMEAPAVAPAAERDAETTPDAAPEAAAAAAAPTDEFMRDLVAAMRKVADEARDAGVTDIRTRADEQVRQFEADAERRRNDLRDRAEQDVAEVGEWERSEQERITREAEQRVVARRSRLDQQLAADATRTEAETKAIRDRVSEYERELESYHAQLIEINDPAAFAAAAKRMPAPPSLDGTPARAPVAAATPDDPAAPVAPAEATPAVTVADDDPVPVEPVAAASNGVPETNAAVHPAEEEVLAARLAELDATLPPATDDAERAATAAAAPSGEPATTEVVVKGLGSFGAITGFRQALSGVDGIDSVALSLGQTGEFVFRAIHAAGFDVRAAIQQLEGDGAEIEDRPEGGLRVTLERAR
jgi:ribonuclease E